MGTFYLSNYIYIHGHLIPVKMVRNTTAAMTKAEFFINLLHEIYLGTLCTLLRICYTKSYARHNDNDWLNYKSYEAAKI